MQDPRKHKTRERGSAMVEVTLMAPWIFFLFIGVYDFGFYSYAAICTENAARAAAILTAHGAGAQDDTLACNAAVYELSWLPNVQPLNPNSYACPSTIDSTHPVAVVRRTLCGKDVDTSIITTCISAPPTNPLCADCAVGLDTKAASSQVAVTYQTLPMVNIPGILTNQLTLTRIVEARIIAE